MSNDDKAPEVQLVTCLVTPGPAISLASGAPAGAGEQVDIDPDDPHNARLIDTQRLVPITEKKPPTKDELLERARELDIKGRSNMNAEQLAEAISAAVAAAEKENS